MTCVTNCKGMAVEILGWRMVEASGEGMMVEARSKGVKSVFVATSHTILGGMILEETNLREEAGMMCIRGLGTQTIREIGGQIFRQPGIALTIEPLIHGEITTERREA